MQNADVQQYLTQQYLISHGTTRFDCLYDEKNQFKNILSGQICFRSLSICHKNAKDIQKILTPCKNWSEARFYCVKWEMDILRPFFGGKNVFNKPISVIAEYV